MRASGGEDYTYLWEAPSEGMFFIDTIGSSIDTIVAVGPTQICNGSLPTQYECDDDIDASAGNYASFIPYYALAGDQLAIIVDSATASGPFALNITALGDGGTCCDDTGAPGCSNPAYEFCVCEYGGASTCCDDQWSGGCALLAQLGCGMTCS